MNGKTRSEMLDAKVRVDSEARQLRMTLARLHDESHRTGRFMPPDQFTRLNVRLDWLRRESQRLQHELGATKPQKPKREMNFCDYFTNAAERILPSRQFEQLREAALEDLHAAESGEGNRL